MRAVIFLLAGTMGVACRGAAPNPSDIVKRSVVAMERNWKSAPEYAFTERDVETRGDSRTVKTSEVLMIEGSPYHRLTAINDHPLSPDRQEEEERKLRQAIARRRKESPDERNKRIAEYEKGRKQDHALMREMADAFDYSVVGEEEIAGRKVWELAATPRPGYQPTSTHTRVLTGMRGKLWIDEATYQWVKVEAEVFRPVSFGLFIAKVRPGTKFELEQAPVGNGLWLPRHFSMRVDSSILFWGRKSSDDETYLNYRPMNERAASNGGATLH